MSVHRLLAIARKEFHHITRDVRTLFLVTITPAFLLVILAYVFSFDVEHFNLIVLDQDRSDVSRQYVADLIGDGAFNLLGYVDSYAEIDDWLVTGRAKLALVIPRGTAADLQAQRSPVVQAVIDGVDSIAGGQAIMQLEARTRLFSLTLLPPIKRPASGVIDTRGLAWYNPSLKSVQSMVPGLIAVVLTMPALALALALTREKEIGSFEGLASTPMRGPEYLFGKMITYVGFGLVSMILVLIVASLWFRVPFRGTLPDLLIVTICYLVAIFGVSMLVANFMKSQQAAMLVMIMVFFIPSFFLAGLILPVDTSSIVTRSVGAALPATHFITISRGVFLKGLGVVDLWPPLSALLLIGGVTVTLSLVLFRKRIG